jgi:hypothetical protein
MVINNLNIFRAICRPTKADTKLVIDPNTPLTTAVTLQSFKPVSRGRSHVLKCCRKVELHELAQCLPLNLGKALATLKLKQDFSLF